MRALIVPAVLPAALIFLALHPAAAQPPRGMTPADTLRVASVGEAQIAPDGGAVAYTVSTVEGNATRTALMLVRPNEARPAAEVLVTGEWNVTRPRWSPDGRRVAFLAAQGQQTGLWVVSLAERNPRFVAAVRATNFHIPYAGEPFAWSPDGRRIAYVNATEESPEPITALGPVADRRDDPRVVERIQYKSRTGFTDRLRSHVWVVDVDAPAPRPLTTGQFYDHAVAWSPRGDEIAFLSNHEPDPDAVNNSDIFAVNLEGRVRQLTTTKGCEYEPAWSPDGRWIAHTATTRDVTTIDSVAEDAHLWLVEAQGGERRELAARLDRRARAPRWTPDGRFVLFLAGDRGQVLVHAARASDGATHPVFNHLATPPPQSVPRGALQLDIRDVPEPLRPPFQIASFSVARMAGAIPPGAPSPATPALLFAFTKTDALNPAEVFVAVGVPAIPALAGAVGRTQVAVARPLSRHNESLLRALPLSAPDTFTFNSFDETPVQAWLMKPTGFRDGERYPLILSVHGGPHGMFGHGFNAAFQAYAARGYAVLFVNPRGSSGYGQKFSDGTLREWGGGDYKDLMAGVDEALRRHPWIDRNRLGVTGGSYGGFMTNWIVTQTTRFRAGVASASVSNLVSFYATSLYQDLIHAEFGGFPWDDYDLLWRWSPLRYVRDVQTPVMFIHGELDNDVHITQAEEMYTALRRRNIDTVLVRYPREGHSLREPRHRQDSLERTLAWFDKYLK